MKQKDIILIVVVVFFSGVFSLLLSNFLIAKPGDNKAQVEVVEPIVADFKQPDERYFNANSINPTQIIKIGEGTNQSPFEN